MSKCYLGNIFEINYEGTLATDLPNGLKAGEKLLLNKENRYLSLKKKIETNQRLQLRKEIIDLLRGGLGDIDNITIWMSNVLFKNRARLLKMKDREQSNFFTKLELRPTGKESILINLFFQNRFFSFIV